MIDQYIASLSGDQVKDFENAKRQVAGRGELVTFVYIPRNITKNKDQFEYPERIDAAPDELMPFVEKVPSTAQIQDIYAVKYNMERIITLDQLKTLHRTFHMKSFNANEWRRLIEDVAMRTVSSGECMRGTECTPLRLNNEFGQFMRREYLNLVKPTFPMERALVEWCKINQNADDCDCIFRSTRPSYINDSQVLSTAPDACWYLPCKNGGAIQDPDLNRNVKCPNICTAVTKVLTKGNVDIARNSVNFGHCVGRGVLIEGEPPEDNNKPAKVKKTIKAHNDETRPVNKLSDYNPELFEAPPPPPPSSASPERGGTMLDNVTDWVSNNAYIAIGFAVTLVLVFVMARRS